MTTGMRYDVVIVGGGHAGAQAAIALRQRGYAGSVAIVGEEAEPPYERPPLTKEYLAGERPFARLLIRAPAFWTERAIDLLGGRRIVAVDPDRREVIAARGERIGYGTLVWAAGGDARRLACAGADLGGVHAVRTRADADAVAAMLPSVRRVCIVGGGYVGLEAAAVLTKLGKRVTLVEAQDRVLPRVAGRTLSRFVAAEHRAHGVDLRLGAAVDRVVGRDGRASGVVLADGAELPCDLVIAGIGIVPAVEPLRAAGAACGDGVRVDARCRTTLPDVYAVGDCALHPNAYAGGRELRLESVQNANDMAVVVAKAICGASDPYDAVPWFWSNQYDLKLQTVGLLAGHDQEVVRGDPASRRFAVVYLRAGRVVALDCVNAVRDYVQGRALLLRACDPARLADVAVPLKDVGIAGDA